MGTGRLVLQGINVNGGRGRAKAVASRPGGCQSRSSTSANTLVAAERGCRGERAAFEDEGVHFSEKEGWRLEGMWAPGDQSRV